MQHGGNNVYLKRATYAAWENYAALLDIPAATFRTFTENTSGDDYLYDFYGPIRVNVPPQISLPSMILAAEQFTPTLNYNKTVSVSSGTDVVMTVLLSGKSTTPNYINVSDITTGEGITVTLGYGPNTSDYSCDIHLTASGGGYPYIIVAKVTRVGSTFASSSNTCTIIVMKK